MKIIKSKTKKQNFISGIFENCLDAEKYYKLITEDVVNNFELISLSICFPFFILEENNDFQFTDDIETIIYKLNHTEPSGNDETVYFNIYVISNNFKTDNPEQDCMGSLSHFHVDNYFLKDYKTKGIKKINNLFKKYGFK